MHYDYTDNYFNDGRETDEPVECYSCKDTVKIKDCDSYRFLDIRNSNHIKNKSRLIKFIDELICTRCTDSFGE